MQVFLPRSQIRALVRAHMGQTTDEALAGSTTAQYNAFLDSAYLKVASDCRWVASANRVSIPLPWGAQSVPWPSGAAPSSFVDAVVLDEDGETTQLERARIPVRTDARIAITLATDPADLGDPRYVDPRSDAIYVWPPSDGETILSATPDADAWVKTGASVSDATISAPLGSDSAFLIGEDSSTGHHNISSTHTLTGEGGYYTFATCVRGNERAAFRLELLTPSSTAGSADFDVVSGVVSNIVSNGFLTQPTARMIPLGGGWYHCSITVRLASERAITTTLRINKDAQYEYAGASGQGLHVWQPIFAKAKELWVEYNRSPMFADDASVSIVDSQLIVLWTLVMANAMEGDRDQSDRYSIQYQSRLNQLRGYESTGVRIRVSSDASFDEDDEIIDLPKWDTRPTVR